MKPAILWLLFTFCTFSEHFPVPFSARNFIKEPQDKGWRRKIREFEQQKKSLSPYAFYYFLEMYDETSSSLDQLKIMQAYFEKFSTAQFRTLSLMFYFNAWNPLIPQDNREVLDFLKNHLYEVPVFDMMLYRFCNHPNTPSHSPAQLYHKIQLAIPDFQFPDLTTLLYLDWAIAGEISKESYDRNRAALLSLWKLEKLNQTSLYKENRSLFLKMITFYSLEHKDYQKFIPTSPVQRFLKHRQEFMESLGLDVDTIRKAIQERLHIPENAMNLPGWFPKNSLE